MRSGRSHRHPRIPANRAATTLALHARVSLVPVTPIASKLVNPNPALIDAYNDTSADALRDLSPTLANRNVQALRGDIGQALASYRRRGLAAAQVDVAGHGIGGLIARGYERTLRTLGRYATRDNYNAGPIHRLITCSRRPTSWSRILPILPVPCWSRCTSKTGRPPRARST
jgi:hypothetical protein